MLLCLPALVLAAEGGSAAEAQDVLNRYFTASREPSRQLRDVEMDVEIDAALPKLNRQGKLNALRAIGRLGQITYKAITFQGDDSIKRDVIAKYMQAEVEASQKPGLGIQPVNYKFRHAGYHKEGGWELYLYELTPKQKKPGLFQGWMWLEARSAMPVREEGEFVKSPSIFLRKISFTRDYTMLDGLSVPSSIRSTVETRVVGKAEILVRYKNLHPMRNESASTR
ncbi:MAG: hypothetical protein IT163_00930 [Bryobacterales bacterium]|nr:hypothetical protein [Bryobacterales bacterium]